MFYISNEPSSSSWLNMLHTEAIDSVPQGTSVHVSSREWDKENANHAYNVVGH